MFICEPCAVSYGSMHNSWCIVLYIANGENQLIYTAYNGYNLILYYVYLHLHTFSNNTLYNMISFFIIIVHDVSTGRHCTTVGLLYVPPCMIFVNV